MSTTADATFDRDDPPILGANPFVGLTRRQLTAALARLGADTGVREWLPPPVTQVSAVRPDGAGWAVGTMPT